jgi:hypothetical protein
LDLTAKDENNLHIFERQILGKIFGPVNIDSIWRIQSNMEIDKLIEGADILRYTDKLIEGTDILRYIDKLLEGTDILRYIDKLLEGAGILRYWVVLTVHHCGGRSIQPNITTQRDGTTKHKSVS